MYRRTAALAVLAVLAAACNGGEEAVSPTQPPITSDTMFVTTTTTEPAAPSTEPSTSSTVAGSSTTSTPPVTVPPTTSPPTTTSSTVDTTSTPGNLEQIRADVVAAAAASYELSDAIRKDPTDEAVLEAMTQAMTEQRIDDIQERFIIPYVANNLVERTNPDLPARFDIRPDTLVVNADAQEATVQACYLSSNLLIELGGNDDGTDKLQDSRFGAVLVERRMVFDDGRWLDDGGANLSTEEGETTCD